MTPLLDAARRWVDQIHVNINSLEERDGHRVCVKRRRRAARLVMGLANIFFRLARNPVEALSRVVDWREWEVEWFRRVHGPEFLAGVECDGAIWVEMLPGESLNRRLADGTLEPAHLAAAGAELRRAHAMECPYYGGKWSHGDSHTGNFIFDPATGRARLMDFEVRHHRSLSDEERQSDDLLVLLQDVCGRCRADAWLPLAREFLAGYGREEIVALLGKKLRVPHGIPRLWWAVRTTWLPREELERRVAALREVLVCDHPGKAGVSLPP